MKRIILTFISVVAILFAISSCGNSRKDPVTANTEKLEKEAADLNASCPMETGKGLVLEAMIIEPDATRYTYTVNEDYFDMGEMNANAENIKAEMKPTLKDPSMAVLLNLCKSTGRSLVYTYTGDRSRETVDIIFTPDEF